MPRPFARLVFARLALATLPLTLALPAGAAPAQTVDAPTREQVVEQAIRAMNEHYVFPDVARTTEAALRALLRQHAFDGTADGPAFAGALTEALRSATHDKHLRVTFSARPLAARGIADLQPSAEELDEARGDEQRRNFGVERVERLPGNLGYIDLRGFAPLAWAGETLAAAMALVAHTDALIVDLRRNGGGDPETVAFLSSYLFDQRTHLNDLYWRAGDRTEQFWTQDWVPGRRYGSAKPVYVLISARTFSGAEEFSYNLRNLKRGTLVGETTGGGANPGDVRRLHPHFELFVPSGRAVSPITKTNWEGVGVEPHVRVPATQALETAQVLALKGLIETTKVLDRKASLQARLAELESAGATAPPR